MHRFARHAPNAITLTSLGCGFGSLVASLSGDGTPESLITAGLLVLVAQVCDLLDGRAARLVGSASPYGAALDSLADLVSFGVAPAALVFVFALEPLGIIGLCTAFAFAACGCVRLARFSTTATDSPSPWFVGMPITFGAGLLASLVVAHQALLGTPPALSAPYVLIVLVLAAAMVSTLPYRSFKGVPLGRLAAWGVPAVGPPVVAVLVFVGVGAAAFVLFSALVLSGPVEWLVRTGDDGPRGEVRSP